MTIDDTSNLISRAQLRKMTPAEVLATPTGLIAPEPDTCAAQASERLKGMSPDQILEYHRAGGLDDLLKSTKES